MSLPRIAIDAMGGDEGVRVMVEGAALARRRHDQFNFLLVGDEERIKRALDTHPNMRGASEILHCEDVVSGDEQPSRAIRRAKTTSMGLAVNAVKEGQAGAAVSAGNTGALMAMSKLALRTMPGIDRPALAALLPTLEEHDVIMLDLGANTEADTRNLVQFAIMGAAYSRIAVPRSISMGLAVEKRPRGDEQARAHHAGDRPARKSIMLDLGAIPMRATLQFAMGARAASTDFDQPRVRLLNIGTEEIKGTDARDAAANCSWRCSSMGLSRATRSTAARSMSS